jgi:Ca2+-binding RTX toxin-like protein
MATPAGKDLELTSKKLSLKGGAGDDFFDALSNPNTLLTRNSIDGGKGNDELDALYNQSFVNVKAKIKNVETISVSSASETHGQVNFDLKRSSGYSTLVNDHSLGDNHVYFQNAAMNSGKLTLDIVGNGMDSVGDTGINLTNAGLAGTSDELTVSLENVSPSDSFSTSDPTVVHVSKAKGGTAKAILETLVVDSATGHNNIYLDGKNLGATSLKLIGDNLQIGGIAESGFKTVDASGYEGNNLSLNLSYSSTGTVTVTGSPGDDQITVGGSKLTQVTVTAGDGSDTIVVSPVKSTAIVSVDAGVGDDSITVAKQITAADTVTGGDGSDTLNFTSSTTLVDSAFTNIKGVETLHPISATLTAFFDTNAKASGLQSVDLRDGRGNITVLSNFTNGLTVDVTGSSSNTVDATASSATVTGVAGVADLNNNTLKGGTGSNDTFSLTADNGTASLNGTTVSGFEKVNVAAGADGTASATVNVADAYLAPGASLTIDGSALGSGAKLTVTDSSESDATASLTVKGGAGNDTINAGASILDLNAGAGNDLITSAASQFDSTDKIDGGADTDILQFTSASSDPVTDVAFTNVKNVEILDLADTGQAVTVDAASQAAGITTINASSSNVNDSITIGSGRTTAAKVNLGVTEGTNATPGTGGSDVVDASASAAALNVLAYVSSITQTDTLKGGTGTSDVLTLYTDNNGNQANLYNVSGFETIVVQNQPDTTFNQASIKLGENSALVGQTLTVDASGLTNGNNPAGNGPSLNLDATLETDTTATITVTGTEGSDTVTAGVFGPAAGSAGAAGAAKFNITFGGGDDTFIKQSENFGGNDTISGGAGTDTIALGGDTLVTDAAFAHVSSVEVLASTGNLNATLGTNANTAGINQVVLDPSADQNSSVTFASGFTNPVEVVMGAGNDIVDASATTASVTVTADNGIEIDTGDTLKGGSGTGDVLFVSGNIDLTNVSGFETVKLSGSGDADITVGANTVATGKTLKVDGSVFATYSAATLMTLNASQMADATATLVVMGTAGTDLVTLGASLVNVDTGAGNDTITMDAVKLSGSQPTIAGGVGTDTLALSGTGASAIPDAAFTNITGIETINASGANALQLTGAAEAQLAGIQTVTGSSGGDTIDLSAFTRDVTVTGGNGADTIKTGSGDDVIQDTGNNNGNDTIDVGNGNNGVEDRSGTNTVSLGNGNDTVVLNLSDSVSSTVKVDSANLNANDHITMFGVSDALELSGTAALADANLSGLLGIENITTGTGGILHITVAANAGIAGLEAVTGGTGDDFVDASVFGSQLELNGGAGVDTLIGGVDDDTITGGVGNDTLTGNGGSDTFVFADSAANNGSDTITDFTTGGGGDILDFSAFAVDGNGTASAPGSITIVLGNPGSPVTVLGPIVQIVDLAGGDDITTAAGLQTALATGELANIDMAVSSKAIFITSATNGADPDFVFSATSDAGGAISVSLVGTLTGNVDIDAYSAANFLV